MKISGLILAGGQGRRMGGTDKGLVSFHQEPFIAHVLRRLAPQVDEILINANQNLETYQSFGYPVISDAIRGFAGPLAG
ncbi:MAG TPA: NTP transferase domain-containing protein, partial [Burkholderiales bacterium]|nr:NTP transferase domain-containing protein [Burkholderiales bacterium]